MLRLGQLKFVGAVAAATMLVALPCIYVVTTFAADRPTTQPTSVTNVASKPAVMSISDLNARLAAQQSMATGRGSPW